MIGDSLFIPRSNIAAFATSPDIFAVLQDLKTHSLLSRAQFACTEGGLDAVINRYPKGGTPDLVILEHDGPIEELERLAEVSATSTQLIVISRDNDVGRYRRLLDQGGADYLFTPITTELLLGAISRTFARAENRSTGALVTFMGCGGGSGASSVAQNAAVLLSQIPNKRVMLLDFDVFTGTVTLTFDLHPVRGLRDLLRDPKSITAKDIAKLAHDRTGSLQILCSPPVLDLGFSLKADHFIDILDQARSLVDVVVIDMPGSWSILHNKLLAMSEHIQLVAVPTLGSFQVLHNIEELTKKLRVNMPPADIILNRWTAASEKLISVNLFVEAAKGGRVIRVADATDAMMSASAAGQCLAEVHPRHGALDDLSVHLAQLAGQRDVDAPQARRKRLWRLFAGKTA
jgi:pilus assembly protein CpaE